MSDWKAMRESAGMTLAELAAKSGYSIGTINGLELRGEGSQRLKVRLAEILTPASGFQASVKQGRAKSVTAGLALGEQAPEYLSIKECRQRIQQLEQEVAELRIALRVAAREINSAPPSPAAELVKRAGAGTPQNPLP